jgi:HEAT repeat protein
MYRYAAVLACACGLGTYSSAFAQPDAFLGKPVVRWDQELSHKDPTVRRSAAFSLGRIGKHAFQSVPSLVQTLKKDQDASVREAAAFALGEIAGALLGAGVVWTEAGPVLQEALSKDADPRVKRSAAFALGNFGGRAVSARASLIAALQDRESTVRQNAAWALGQLGIEAGSDASGALADLLKDADALVRRDAAGALGKIGKPAASAAVRPLLASLKPETDDVVRRTILEALIALAGPDDRPAAGDLYPLLKDEDPETARAAGFVLCNIGGPEGAKALPVVIAALQDEDPAVQALAAGALANLGPDAVPATVHLARALVLSKDDVVRRNAALALGRIGPDAKDAVPELIKALEPGEPRDVRLFAAEGLAYIRFPGNEKALPTILRILKDRKDYGLIRQRCVWALFDENALKQPGAVEALTATLDETAENEAMLARYDAARLLAQGLGERAPDKVIDVLLQMLRNEELKVYNRTDAKIGSGGEASAGGSDVRPNLGGDARYMAATALGYLGTKARKDEVLRALREAAKSTDGKLRQTAEKALKDIGG